MLLQFCTDPRNPITVIRGLAGSLRLSECVRHKGVGRAARIWGLGSLYKPPHLKTQDCGYSELSSVIHRPVLKSALCNGLAGLRLFSHLSVSPQQWASGNGMYLRAWLESLGFLGD